jgi:TolB-like protein/cytochrome c-type biogenesis protein CcmH/NrfG/predicted Ser/Thr protein kinase
MLTVGSTVSHYRILEKLGAGGMGVVYKAEDTRLGRTVALKVLPPERVADPDRKRRFVQEARAASALNHPNIITIYDIDEVEGVHFIAMEYVDGETLDRLIAHHGLPVEKTLAYAVEMAAALAKAHSAGIVHRDLKPTNVMVTNEGLVKILDFGLAKLTEAAPAGESETVATAGPRTEEGMILGTVGYMSPEQAEGKPVDARSDIFSFGSVLYEMLAGRRAFHGETNVSTIAAILREEPKPLSQVSDGLPHEVERLVKRCLRKDRQHRFQHMDDVKVALEELKEESDSGELIPPAGTDRGVRRAEGTGLGALIRRRRFVAIAAAAAVAAVVALLLALNVGGLRNRVLRGGGMIQQSAPRIQSLAVLPLENLSHDPEQEYFADGMTDALIAELGQIGSLRVISRTSVMRYKGTDKPLPQIARELNVDALVEGSVLRAGDRIRITAQLIGAVPERHLWARSYERDLRDALSLQGEVARTIASEVKANVTPDVQARLARARPVNPEAHQLYLLGRFYWNKRTEEGFKKAIDYFQRAIEIDPGYAPAYAGLADSYILLSNGGILPAKEGIPKGKAAAQKALEIDESLAEAHTSLAFARTEYDWDWAGAEREFKRAIELNPNYATAHHWYGDYLSDMRRHAEAIAELQRAQQLDPLSPQISGCLGGRYYAARQYQEAIRRLQNAVSLFPDSISAHAWLGAAYRANGMYPEAIDTYQKMRSLSGASTAEVAALGQAYAKGGIRGYDLWELQRLREESRHRYVKPAAFAFAYAALGEKDQAFSYLEKAYENRDSELTRLQTNPRLDPLRSDPRFQDLLRRMNFPP